MKSLPDKIRIKDIARLANVSTGTVDRVLHNRGEVSAKSREKVEKVLKEIHYQPNIYASALASKKRYTFVTLLPESNDGDYWSDIKKGVDQAAHEFLDLNISVEQIFFNQYDSESFVEAIRSVLRLNPDAVLLAPIFKEQVIFLAEQLNIQEVPYVMIDSDMEEIHPLAYFGMDSLQSGYLAAKLLLNEAAPNTEIAVFQVHRSGNKGSNQTELRIKGFKRYIEEHLPDAKLLPVKIYAQDHVRNLEIIKEFFEQHPHIREAITFNSKVYLITDYLTKMQIPNIKFIGYDLLQKNVEALKAGKVNYLLAQRPEIQSYRGMKALCEYKIFKNEIKRKNFMPIDILARENIDFYLDFQAI
ncbi:LacI family DNA-binding transcriptional regulator [Coprobacter sp.]